MKTFLSIALAFTLIAPITTAMAANKKDNMKLADKPLVIVRQGQFNVGGTTLQRAGHTTTRSSWAGRSRTRPGSAFWATMPTWSIRFHRTPAGRRSSSFMALAAAAPAGSRHPMGTIVSRR